MILIFGFKISYLSDKVGSYLAFSIRLFSVSAYICHIK